MTPHRVAVPRDPTRPRPALPVEPAGFFVLRTPLLPFDEYVAWGEGLEAPAEVDTERLAAALGRDRTRLGERLRHVIDRPPVREALFIASPTLDESIQAWLESPDSPRGKQVEHVLVRYLARMAGRATPFGLFAGFSVGVVDATCERSTLRVGPLGECGRHTRLDVDYLYCLGEALSGLPALRPHLRVRPNSSLYRTGGRLRYVETRRDGRARGYHLVAVEPTEYLEATLRRAAGGATARDLAHALCEADPAIDRADAVAYIDELIEAQVLVTDLSPQVTGPEPVHAMIEQLRAVCEVSEAASAAERLDATRRALAELDARPIGAGEPPYRALARGLSQLPTKAALSGLFHVELTKPAGGVVGADVLGELSRAIELLRGTASVDRDHELSRFRERFLARWGAREVALVEALDEESGIGMGHRTPSGAPPLLAGLAFPPAATPVPSMEPGFAHLLGRLVAGRGAREMCLDETDWTALASGDPPPLPDSFAVIASLAAASPEAQAGGDFRVHLLGVSRSGTNYLSRFCHTSPVLTAAVRRYLADEEALRPDVIVAQVVHLPDGRGGNVVLRPELGRYEIPFLGRSGAPPDRQISVDDLLVSVSGNRIVLRSRRLGREVVPRNATAHTFPGSRLGIYRFLSSLQHQDAPSLGWRWGVLEAAPFLPRVVTGRVVLSSARWRLDQRQVVRLGCEHGATLYRTVRELGSLLGLPRHVAFIDGDHALPVDLDNVLSVEAFARLVKGRTSAILSELVPDPDESYAVGPEGRFVHELVIPYLRAPRTAVTAIAPEVQRHAAREAPAPRTFAPGSEWLYAKLYAGWGSLDRLLAAAMSVVRRALDSRAADGWFFVRYDDPDWHLRLRLHGDPARLAAEVLPSLHAQVAPWMADGRAWKLEIDTYEREIERYGGPEGMAVCERIFQADSEAVATICEALSRDGGEAVRWRFALLGCHRLLEDLGLDPARRRTLFARLRDGYAKEHGIDPALERQLGERYRRERRALEALLAPSAQAVSESPHAPAFAAFAARSAALALPARALRELAAANRLTVKLDDLAASLLHMHLNRTLRSAARAQELVIYDLLSRIYRSREAREQRKR